MQDISLTDALKNFRKWASITSWDMFNKYLPEASENDETLLTMLKQLKTHYPLHYAGILLSAKNSIYPLTDIFGEELSTLPDKNTFKYGANDLGFYINQTLTAISRGYIHNKRYISKFLYQSYNSMDNYDWQTFRFVLEQRLPSNICETLERLAIEKQLPIDGSDYFMGVYEFLPKNSGLFADKVENAYIASELEFYIKHNQAMFKIDGDKITVVPNIKHEGKVFIMSDGKLIAKGDNFKVTDFVLSDIIKLSEPDFDEHILNGKKYIFLIDDKKQIKSIFTQSDLSNEKVKSSGFKVLPSNPVYNSVDIIELECPDANKKIYARCLCKTAENIAPNTKVFNLACFDGKYYYKGK